MSKIRLNLNIHIIKRVLPLLFFFVGVVFLMINAMEVIQVLSALIGQQTFDEGSVLVDQKKVLHAAELLNQETITPN